MAFAVDCALIVIDVQNDFCLGVDAVVEKINRTADEFQVKVFTQDWHPPDHASFAVNHAGKQAFEAIDFPYGTQVFWTPHCVQGTREPSSMRVWRL